MSDKPIVHERVPEPIDDIDASAPAPDPAPQRVERNDDAPLEPVGESPVKVSIVEAYRKKRNIEEGLEPPDDDLPSEDAVRGVTPAPQARPQAGPSDSGGEQIAANDPELIVYGDRFKARRSDLAKRYNIAGADDATIIRIAQKELAADRRLTETRNAPQAPQAEHHRKEDSQTREAAPEPDRSTPGKTTLDDDKLEEIASRIQIGDTEEGKAALREVIEIAASAADGAVRVEQVPELINNVITQREHLSEVNRAVAKFGENNPDIVSNPDLRTVVLDVSARKMREAMAEVGVPQQSLDALGNDRVAVADAYHALRRQGYRLKGTDDLLTDVEGHIRSTFGLAKPAAQNRPHPQTPPAATDAQIQERMRRKAAAPQQPRHGGARTEAPQTARPKTPREIVESMRGQRHFR